MMGGLLHGIREERMNEFQQDEPVCGTANSRDSGKKRRATTARRNVKRGRSNQRGFVQFEHRAIGRLHVLPATSQHHGRRRKQMPILLEHKRELHRVHTNPRVMVMGVFAIRWATPLLRSIRIPCARVMGMILRTGPMRIGVGMVARRLRTTLRPRRPST